MKKIFTLIIFTAAFLVNGYAQEKTDENNCYFQWARKFEERGATDVEDGTHMDVIISFRSGSTCECKAGKAEVKNGKVIALYLKMEDGSFEKVNKKLKYETYANPTVQNGISSTILTAEDELINVVFYKKLKPKKKGYVEAPSPSDF